MEDLESKVAVLFGLSLRASDMLMGLGFAGYC